MIFKADRYFGSLNMKTFRLALKLFVFAASIPVWMQAQVSYRDHLRQQGVVFEWNQHMQFAGFICVYFIALLTWTIFPYVRKTRTNK